MPSADQLAGIAGNQAVILTMVPKRYDVEFLESKVAKMSIAGNQDARKAP